MKREKKIVDMSKDEILAIGKDPTPYAIARQMEYPSVGDQLDTIMKWIAAGDDAPLTPELKNMAALCMGVKSKNPKP